MRRLLTALLVCGMGVLSYAGLLPSYEKLVVLKGTCTDTVHYVHTTASPNPAYGVTGIGLSAKPKVYYFLVVYLEYTPLMAAGRWIGEGDLYTWTMGTVEYGSGMSPASVP